MYDLEAKNKFVSLLYGPQFTLVPL